MTFGYLLLGLVLYDHGLGVFGSLENLLKIPATLFEEELLKVNSFSRLGPFILLASPFDLKDLFLLSWLFVRRRSTLWRQTRREPGQRTCRVLCYL